MSSDALDAPDGSDRPYPLVERVFDLFLEPRRLFAELARRPRFAGAAVAATAASIAFSVATMVLTEPPPELDTPDLPGWTFAVVVVLGATALWAYLAVSALLGMAFAGFAGADLPYRHWLALAAHCSLVSLLVVPLQIAGVLLTGDAGLQLGLADLTGREEGLLESLLGRVTLRTGAYLALFSYGASVFTGASWARAAIFLCGVWASTWLALSWLTVATG